ncbi:hypothetical protein BTS2_3948 [Bacillus sp. TS-2]|nr:hypothetical protein BTS2_3948 [Bacillus sp. TS-2]
MHEKIEVATQMIEKSGWIAPLFFILLHLIRPFLFIPVLITCMIGGYLFGLGYGSIYSVIGLGITSALFYWLLKIFPSMEQKLLTIKVKLLGKNRELSNSQLMIMRMIPFIHFHIVSLYIYESTQNYQQYIFRSFLFILPPAIIFTAFGDIIHQMPLYSAIALTLLLLISFFFSRKKQVVIKWNDFFTS